VTPAAVAITATMKMAKPIRPRTFSSTDLE
jgi:hypothetical protein